MSRDQCSSVRLTQAPISNSSTPYLLTVILTIPTTGIKKATLHGHGHFDRRVNPRPLHREFHRKPLVLSLRLHHQPEQTVYPPAGPIGPTKRPPGGYGELGRDDGRASRVCARSGGLVEWRVSLSSRTPLREEGDGEDGWWGKRGRRQQQ